MMPPFFGEKQILFKVLLDILKSKNQAKNMLVRNNSYHKLIIVLKKV